MIELRKTNGDLIVPEFKFTSSFDISNLQTQKNQQIKAGIHNQEYQSFQISNIDSGEFNFTIYFYKQKILFISISLGNKYYSIPFVITEEQQVQMKNILQSLGGINKYSWGSVEWSEDLKGGILSIIIRYLNGPND